MTTKLTTSEIDAAYQSVAEIVRDRLSRNQRIRRNLPGEGRVRFDRQLPFLCVYRTLPPAADAGTCELVTTEAAYLFAPADPAHAAGLQHLIAEIADTLCEHFGTFLVIEIWSDDDREKDLPLRDATRPGFRVYSTQPSALARPLNALTTSLRDIRLQGWSAEVAIVDDELPTPPGHPALAAGRENHGVQTIGIAVRPVYRDGRTGIAYPVMLRSLRRQLAVALRKTVFAFTGQHKHRPSAHFEALGPSTMVKAARLVDQQLSEVSQSFDFVLQTVPLNTNAAWEEFQADGHRCDPVFYYRPLPYDPALLKRRLFEIPIDRIEDSTLIHLFAEKQDHLDRQLSALKNIDAPPFFYDSIQLYGLPDKELVDLATSILARLNARADDEGESCDPTSKSTAKGSKRAANDHCLHTEELVAAARREIDFYHRRLPSFVAKVEVRDDVAASMMVAHDRLLVSSSAVLSRNAVKPLLHHEIGTHLLTYFNGQQQPFQQLYAGLARYEELQEGLAVWAEYVVGGLTRSRIRTLAGRVIAVQALVERRSFVETFQLLHTGHHLAAKAAFMTTLRVFRGGGLTKDAIYLRGLHQLVDYLRQGHDPEPLYVGKIALDHVPLVQELRRRGIVGPPALLPRFWDDPAATERLDRCRHSSLLELLEHEI